MAHRLSISSSIRAILVLSMCTVAIGLGTQACGGGDGSSNTSNNGANGSNPYATFGGNGGNGDGGLTACSGLQCQQVACSGGGHTTLSGTIYDPAGKNPLYDVVVYVPNSKPDSFVDHATCDQCSALYTGNPIVTTLTDAHGKFILSDVPAGNDIPLVIQIGKWRRQVKIPSVTECQDNPITDKNMTRLPANRGEGDIPKIAISTGGADTMECLLRRVGVDASEFVGGAGTGTERIHIFQGTNGHAAVDSTPSDSTLWESETELAKYDMVILSCEGGENTSTKPMSSRQALEDYANAGGRVFASHFHYYWFSSGPAPFPSTATWTTGSQNIGDIRAAIDQSFPKGASFAQWMQTVNALQSDGTMQIIEARHNADVNPTVNKGVQPWITDADQGRNFGATQYFTFNTPLGAAADAQCGRVVYSDLHVGAASHDFATSDVVPDGCSTKDLSAQEKALEFMLFDLSSCVTPDNQAPSAPQGSGGVR